MSVYSFLKSPIFLTGVGTVFSGAIGVGSWQVYEETFPTNHRKFSKLGYKWEPIVPPNETKEKDVRWKWNNWGCVNRFFPKVEFKHNLDSSQSSSSYPPSSEDLSLFKETNPIGCAIMELQPVEHENKTYLYFKSEFVIKGKNVGWVLWTGLSNVPEKKESQSIYSNSLNFLHQLIFLKKKGDNTWEIKEGYQGSVAAPANQSTNKYFVKAPNGHGFNPRNDSDNTPFEEKRGAGVWEVDNGAEEGFLKGVEVYIGKPEYAEILGSDGTFSTTEIPGFCLITTLYEKTKGGVSGSYKEAPSRFTQGYAPFKDLKGKGTDLKSRCNALSSSRKPNESNLSELKDLCGSK